MPVVVHLNESVRLRRGENLALSVGAKCVG